MKSPPLKWLLAAWIQGAFYVLTGLWPLLHIASFQWVTGPKADLWLVRTVALLVTVTGLLLLRAARRRLISQELVLIAIGQALALTAIDLLYVWAGRISPIYLMDAAGELVLVGLWLASGVLKATAPEADPAR